MLAIRFRFCTLNLSKGLQHRLRAKTPFDRVSHLKTQSKLALSHENFTPRKSLNSPNSIDKALFSLEDGKGLLRMYESNRMYFSTKQLVHLANRLAESEDGRKMMGSKAFGCLTDSVKTYFADFSLREKVLLVHSFSKLKADILEHLIGFLEPELSNMNFKEICLLTWAYSKSIKPNSPNFYAKISISLTPKLNSDFLIQEEMDGSGLNYQGISMLVWAFGEGNVQDPELFENLEGEMKKAGIEKIPLMCLPLLATGYSKMQFESKIIVPLILNKSGDWDSVPVLGIRNLLLALPHNPVNKAAADKLIRLLCSRGKGEMSGKFVTTTLHAFVQHKISDLNLLGNLFENCRIRLPTLNIKDCEMLFRGIVWGKKLGMKLGSLIRILEARIEALSNWNSKDFPLSKLKKS